MRELTQAPLSAKKCYDLASPDKPDKHYRCHHQAQDEERPPPRVKPRPPQHQFAAFRAGRIVERRRRFRHPLPAADGALIRLVAPPGHVVTPAANADVADNTSTRE